MGDNLGITPRGDSGISVSVSKSLFDVMAVQFAAHKFLSDYFISLEELPDNSIGVYFKTKNDPIKEGLLIEAFHNELLNQQVRLNTEKLFGNIRELIVTQAFSPIENKPK